MRKHKHENSRLFWENLLFLKYTSNFDFAHEVPLRKNF